VRGPFDFRLLGGTLDDAVGEAFDKAAKMFGLPYPGGPEVDRRAELGNAQRFLFARMQTPGLDFSYSGLKTSILYTLQKEQKLRPDTLEADLDDWCASARQALIQPLLDRLDRALKTRASLRRARRRGRRQPLAAPRSPTPGDPNAGLPWVFRP